VGFVGWLKHQARRGDEIGDFARWWQTDGCRPRGGVGAQSVELHLKEKHPEHCEVGARAFQLYMEEENGPARALRTFPRRRRI
jgi:hypothetical protein